MGGSEKVRRRSAATARWVVFVVVLAGCTEGPSLPSHHHPVIIIDIDTLAAKHLGTYGYPRNTSPNIDAFAEQSIQFDWAFSQAPNTPPSQTSILTGLYPSTHGMIQDDDRVPQEVTTLAEAFSARGFRTAAFVDGGYMAPVFGHDQGFEIYDNSNSQGVEKIWPKALAWIEEHQHRDFFLLIHTYDVHWPYDPPEPFRSMFTEGLEPPTPGFEPDTRLEAVRRNKPEMLPANDLAFAKARYDAGIRYVDAWFGEFLNQLRELDLLNKVTIVVISDHGEEFQQHGSVGHDKLYATVTHIPLVIRIPDGGVVSGPSFVDC